MDKLLSVAIAQASVVFPVLIAAVIAMMLLAGRPRRWYGWIAQSAGALAGLVLALLLYFCLGLQAAVKTRVQSTTFTLAGAERVHRLDEYRGRVVVLNYWATWCPLCRAEMPDLNRLADRYREEGVVVVTVSDEPWETIDRYTARHPLTTVVGQFRSEPPPDAVAAFAYQGRPMTMILDRQGRVAKLLVGAQDYAGFEEALKKVL